MSFIVRSELKAGIIYGDPHEQEYVYMPGSELGVAEPLCIYESQENRQDVSLDEAVRLVRLRSLKPAYHPRLGKASC